MQEWVWTKYVAVIIIPTRFYSHLLQNSAVLHAKGERNFLLVYWALVPRFGGLVVKTSRTIEAITDAVAICVPPAFWEKTKSWPWSTSARPSTWLSHYSCRVHTPTRIKRHNGKLVFRLSLAIITKETEFLDPSIFSLSPQTEIGRPYGSIYPFTIFK